MSIIGWIVLGLVSGFIVSRLMHKEGSNTTVDIVLGMVGALVGGLVYTRADVLGITMANVYSIVVAMVGSAIMLVVYHKILKH